jgi:integrase
MPRIAKPLSAREVATLKKPGVYFDGHGLALRVGPTGAKSWVFRYTGADGKRHDLGLGPLHTIGLAEARELALAARKQRLNGVDPLQTRQAEKRDRKLAPLKTAVTFAEAADAYIRSHSAGWRDPRAEPQWRASLRDYATPVIGDVPVDAIDTRFVMKCIEPIWTTRTETASRVRARIEAILDWARVAGYREGENSARWKGHLENLLPRKTKVRKVEHHAALSHSEIAAFMGELRQVKGVAARALEFLILSACRVGEVINARWSDLDRDARAWVIPAERMKAAQPHRVPLSDAALAILDRMSPFRRADDFVFPGSMVGRSISASAIRLVMDHLGGGATAHGMRACFRSWCADTGVARDVAEQCLAHSIGNAVEQAYNRSDLFKRRRGVMETWANFIDHDKAANIVPMRKGA